MFIRTGIRPWAPLLDGAVKEQAQEPHGRNPDMAGYHAHCSKAIRMSCAIACAAGEAHQCAIVGANPRSSSRVRLLGPQRRKWRSSCKLRSGNKEVDSSSTSNRRLRRLAHFGKGMSHGDFVTEDDAVPTLAPMSEVLDDVILSSARGRVVVAARAVRNAQ